MKRGNKDEPLIKDVTGVILAGGKSSRYGKNKSFVIVNGIPLIERVIREMKDVFQDVIIITNTPNEVCLSHLSHVRGSPLRAWAP